MLKVGPEIVLLGWTVRLCSEPAQSVIVDVDSEWVDTADQYVKPQIKLVPLD